MTLFEEISQHIQGSGYGATALTANEIELTDGAVAATVEGEVVLAAFGDPERAATILRSAKTNPDVSTLRRWARGFGVSTRTGRRQRPYREIQRDLLLVAEVIVETTPPVAAGSTH